MMNLRYMSIVLVGLVCHAPIALSEEAANDVEIIRAPGPDYPYLAAMFGAEGTCSVRFSLYEYGDRIEVQSAMCSDSVFCEAAEAAVKSSRLRVIDHPATETPGERRNLVYPIAFTLQDHMDLIGIVEDHECTLGGSPLVS